MSSTATASTSAPRRFEKGEPFCHLMPVRRGELEAVEPELRLLSEDPGRKRQDESWGASRSQFNTDLRQPGSVAQADKWQKMYHRGVTPEGAPGAADHRTRIKLRPFAKASGAS